MCGQCEFRSLKVVLGHTASLNVNIKIANEMWPLVHRKSSYRLSGRMLTRQNTDGAKTGYLREEKKVPSVDYWKISVPSILLFLLNQVARP